MNLKLLPMQKEICHSNHPLTIVKGFYASGRTTALAAKALTERNVLIIEPEVVEVIDNTFQDLFNLQFSDKLLTHLSGYIQLRNYSDFDKDRTYSLVMMDNFDILPVAVQTIVLRQAMIMAPKVVVVVSNTSYYNSNTLTHLDANVITMNLHDNPFVKAFAKEIKGHFLSE